MRWTVACLLILGSFNSAALTQTPARRSQPSGAGKPAIETMTICQGVPLPNGYVIIAYMTSSACPHGAYVLKKQTDYETSLTMSNGAQSAGNASTAASEYSKPTGSPVRGTGTQAGRKSSTRPSALNGSPMTPSHPSGDPATAMRASPDATRVRRVGFQAQNTTQAAPDPLPPEGPPSLIGAAPPGPRRPPALTNQGDAATASSTIQSADVTAVTGPEEVSEGDVIRVDTTLISVPVSVLDRQ